MLALGLSCAGVHALSRWAKSETTPDAGSIPASAAIPQTQKTAPPVPKHQRGRSRGSDKAMGSGCPTDQRT